MNIILGASGHVGSTVAKQLLKNGEPVQVILRDENKVADWEQKGAKVALADVKDVEALGQAFKGGERLFMMIPPANVAGDVVQDEFHILDNYKKALAYSDIKKFVGLSSYGSEHFSNTGNLLTTNRMEHLFNDLSTKKSFVRPAYFSATGIWLWTRRKMKASYTPFSRLI